HLAGSGAAAAAASPTPATAAAPIAAQAATPPSSLPAPRANGGGGDDDGGDVDSDGGEALAEAGVLIAGQDGFDVRSSAKKEDQRQQETVAVDGNPRSGGGRGISINSSSSSSNSSLPAALEPGESAVAAATQSLAGGVGGEAKGEGFRRKGRSRGSESMDWSWNSEFGTKHDSSSRRGEVYMSMDVLDQVWTAEMSFLRDMYLLDADFFRFVWGLLQQPEAAEPGTAALAVHAGTKIAVEMVAHARASSCVAPWCTRLSGLVRAHQHAADNVLALLAAGQRKGKGAGYLRELLVSCPRPSTRLAFERLAVDAIAASSNRPAATEDPTALVGHKHTAAALSGVLLDLLEEESYGAARGSSPGGLTHLASVVAAAAANSPECAALISGGAVPRLLGCLKARYLREINGSVPS
ncbi:unnamed protein product, partial [Scytosiphon promiscuus]